jgi:hypothetical protein
MPLLLHKHEGWKKMVFLNPLLGSSSKGVLFKDQSIISEFFYLYDFIQLPISNMEDNGIALMVFFKL